MNQSQSRTIRYAVAGLCSLALLLVIGWLVLHEPRAASDQQPVKAATASPRTCRVAPLVESATTNVNAAAIYRQAFAIYDALTKEQKDLIANWRTNVDASVAAELCEKIQPICDRMHQAAAETNCDWGLEQPITFHMLLPHLGPCQNIARAAIWSVAHCRTDSPSAAVDDLVAASRLGQNVSSPALIGHMVDLAIQDMVIDSVTDHASVLVGASDTPLVELLNDADYNEKLRRAIGQEADMVTREADRLAAMRPEEVMRELVALDGSSSALRSMGTVQAIADIRQAAELQRQYAQALGLPEADYRKWLTSLDVVRKTNLFVDLLVTPLEKARDRTQAMMVESAMAVAGLAVMQGGPGTLQSHPDPTTSQPFAWTQIADGFELESGFQVLEKPLKLTFKRTPTATSRPLAGRK
jgi:hypothetical protein